MYIYERPEFIGNNLIMQPVIINAGNKAGKMVAPHSFIPVIAPVKAVCGNIIIPINAINIRHFNGRLSDDINVFFLTLKPLM